MPEKRTDVFSIIKGVFKNKKDENCDIVCEAERVISDYIGLKKYDIEFRYKKRNRFAKMVMVSFAFAVLYVAYRVLI